MAQQITGQAQGLVLGSSQKAGTPSAVSIGWNNEQISSELLPRYAYLVLSGNVYHLSVTAASPTGAFPFAAAGTPLLAAYNPPGSGKNLILIGASIGVKTTGTAAVSWTAGVSLAGVSAIGTGTTTVPTNLLSLQKSGSVATGFINTALTANTLSTGVATVSLLSGGLTAATAVTNVTPAWNELPGYIVVTPGNLIALGMSTTPTGGAFDANMTWAELPA